nr:MAG: hypothetical protein [Bacteriophage sp.]
MEDIRDIIEEKAVEKLKKSAFAKEHSGCLVVDAECQLPEEAQEGALCIVRRPEHHIGRDALFVRDSSKWRFRCCGTIPETTVYKGEVTRMSDLPLTSEIGDFYKVGSRTLFYNDGWNELASSGRKGE